MRGATPTGEFDGPGACLLEMGDGLAAYASGDFCAEPTPQIRLRRPGPHWHLARLAFQRYWLGRWFR